MRFKRVIPTSTVILQREHLTKLLNRTWIGRSAGREVAVGHANLVVGVRMHVIDVECADVIDLPPDAGCRIDRVWQREIVGNQRPNLTWRRRRKHLVERATAQN